MTLLLAPFDRVQTLCTQLQANSLRALRKGVGFVPTTEHELTFCFFKLMILFSNMVLPRFLSRAMASYMIGADGDMESSRWNESEKSLKRSDAAISSMTKPELKDPSIIDSKRRKRIARGAGVREHHVAEMLSFVEIMCVGRLKW